MIGILCIIDLNYIPYLKKYTDYLDKIDADYEVIYWKRLDTKEEVPFKTVEFCYNADLSLSRKEKLIGFAKYRKFVVNTLNDKKYDRLIVLSTLMGILVSDVLTKKYAGKFIFDIRDYTYEYLAFYKAIESKIIKSSWKTVISSDGFREFLPESNKYILCHNFLESEIDESRRFIKKTSGSLELTFIGAVRHFDLDKSVVDVFCGDSRFDLVFHGYGASYDALLKYTIGKRVKLTGRYNRNDKEQLLESTDIINSYYDEKNIVNRYAVSNKYYDAAIYRKPLWANPDTYIGTLAYNKGIGLNCKIDPDSMFEEYNKIDPEQFEASCERIVKEILQDEQLYLEMLGCFALNI